MGLQEVRLKVSQHQLICDALNQHMKSKYKPFLCKDWYDPHILANAFLTRIPVIEHERIELPEGFRTAQRVLIKIDEQTINVVNTHLHHKPYRDEVIRLKQLDYILNWIEPQGHPTILMGDLNARPDSTTIQRAKGWFQSAYEAIHCAEPDVTFPSPLRADENLTPRTIDYILCDEEFTIKACQLIANQPADHDTTLYPSDHFGLVAEIV
ncbi:MAG: endonuclease/exonuclease/phosphatase family protein [Chloroflexota bacterium]